MNPKKENNSSENSSPEIQPKNKGYILEDAPTLENGSRGPKELRTNTRLILIRGFILLLAVLVMVEAFVVYRIQTGPLPEPEISALSIPTLPLDGQTTEPALTQVPTLAVTEEVYAEPTLPPAATEPPMLPLMVEETP